MIGNKIPAKTIQPNKSKYTKVGRDELELDVDTQEFIDAWPAGSIVKIANIKRKLLWEKS
jgi:hypothetical protein